MKHLYFILFFVFTAVLTAEEEVQEKDPTLEFYQSIQEQSMDFVEAYDQARDAGVSSANLTAGKVLYYLTISDLEALIRMAPELEAIVDEIDYGVEKIFAAKSQLLGLVRSLEAAQAFRNDDKKKFEEKAKEAFWLSPEWVRILQIDQLILGLRGEEIKKNHLQKLIIPMETQVRDLEGNLVSLNALVADKKAILMDFWASWCGPCIRLMPELKKKSDLLGPQGIYVVGMNTDNEDPLVKAKGTQKELKMEMPWLVEDEAQTLSQLLMIDSIPHMALIAPDGTLLWSGYPMDEGLEVALKKLGISLEESTDE